MNCSPEFQTVEEVHEWAKANGFKRRAHLWQKPDRHLYIKRLSNLAWQGVEARYITVRS